MELICSPIDRLYDIQLLRNSNYYVVNKQRLWNELFHPGEQQADGDKTNLQVLFIMLSY